MSEVAKHPWLTRRKNVFYVRAPVPKDIVNSFGRREVTYSLRTSELCAARDLIDVEAAKIRCRFDEHRAQRKTSANPDALPPSQVDLSPLELQRFCEERYQYLVDEDFEWRFRFREQLQDFGEDDLAWCDAVNKGLQERSEGLIVQLVPLARIGWFAENDLTRPEVLLMCINDLQRQHLSGLEFKLSLADLTDHLPIAREYFVGLAETDYRRVARRYMEIERDAYNDIVARDAGRYAEIVEKCAERAFSSVKALGKPQGVSSGPSLSSLLEAFLAEGQRQGLALKTLKGDETDLREFISVAGDKPIRNFLKADAIAFKEVLTRCPANRKSETYRGLKIADCAALADENGKARRLSPSTINDKLNALSKFFVWANGHLEDVANPFDGTRIKIKKSRAKRAQDRLPFSIEELQTIFGSTIYTGCASRSSWKKPGDIIPRGSARFWAPLISLFSGLRLGEIIQLRVADIKIDADGIRYFDITTAMTPDDAETAKSLKTSTSERQVPVHDFLFRCGLQELIDAQRNAGEARLLMDYGPSKADGSWSKNFRGWFNGQFRTHIGVSRIVQGQNRVNFHSFRHNFEDVVRNLPHVKQEVRDALQGHGENGVSAQYGTGIYRKTLNEALQQVDYEGLDLSHLVV